MAALQKEWDGPGRARQRSQRVFACDPPHRPAQAASCRRQKRGRGTGTRTHKGGGMLRSWVQPAQEAAVEFRATDCETFLLTAKPAKSERTSPHPTWAQHSRSIVACTRALRSYEKRSVALCTVMGCRQRVRAHARVCACCWRPCCYCRIAGLQGRHRNTSKTHVRRTQPPAKKAKPQAE